MKEGINITENRNAKPFLRWAGGKQNLVKYLFQFVPKDYKEHTYIEPFLGAGSLFFKLCPQKAILSDLNVHLINSYKMIRKNFQLIHRYLLTHKRLSSRNYYYKIRAEFNQRINSISIAQAARFIYLNKTCYNGIFRVNKSGLFNVPYGNKENPKIPSYNELKNISKQLKKTKLFSFSYEKILSLAKKKDFVYLDPPYPQINENSNFTQYTKENFSDHDQIMLASFAEELNRRGCNVLISNADINKIRQLYSKWFMESIEVTRYITCKKIKYKVKELVITNYNP